VRQWLWNSAQFQHRSVRAQNPCGLQTTLWFLPNSNTQLSVSKWASRLGADYSIYPLTALFYVYGKPADNPRARDTARIGIEALADAEITINVLKAVTQRPRPETKDTNISFWRGGDAFPSGHSIQSWALARVVSREFSDNRFVPFLAYGLASTVSVARVAGRRHSPSEAFLGSAMGFFIGDYVYRAPPRALEEVSRFNVDRKSYQYRFWKKPLGFFACSFYPRSYMDTLKLVADCIRLTRNHNEMAYGVSHRSSCEDFGRKIILVGNARERDESCEAISGPRSPEQR
jgi:membrane-associated phospholipid phosphatase